MKMKIDLSGEDALKKQLEEMAKEVKNMPNIKAGVPEGDYPDGTPLRTVGFVNEFGSEVNHIPERSFLRSTLNENKDEYVKMLGTALNMYLNSNMKLEDALGIVGLKLENDIKDKIRDLDTPPNAPETIARKKSDSPLVDTGLLMSSIMYEIGD